MFEWFFRFQNCKWPFGLLSSSWHWQIVGTDILSHFPIPLSLNVNCPVLFLAQVISKALENRFPWPQPHFHVTEQTQHFMLCCSDPNLHSNTQRLFENVTKKGPMCCFGISWWHISLVIDWISVVSLGGFYGINPFAVNINVNRCYHPPLLPPPTSRSINPKTQRVCTWFS